MEENRYKRMLRAIEAERENEEQYYLDLNAKNARPEKIKSGVLLFPLSLEKSSFTIGERIELSFIRTKNTEQIHRFKVGVACTVGIEGSTDEIFKASISFSRKNEFKVILSNTNLNISQFSKSSWYYLEMTYDEKPYRVMREAITSLLNTKSVPHQEMRDGIAKGYDFSYEVPSNFHFNSSALNPSQNKAINGLLGTDRIGIIHGPPGTGKTTTIVELVKVLVKSEKRVLVCAPSNNAVDLLANRIDKSGVSVVRVGNVTRIDDGIAHLTLESKTRNNTEWNHIKKVRIEAEEAKRSAGTYKRKFGGDERSYRSMMYKEAKELRKWARELEDRLVESIVDNASVIAATLIGIESKYIKNLAFETVIIDEASQTLEPECWNAILRAKRVILVGDHLQLPPVVKSKAASQYGLEETLLDVLTDRVKHSYFLNLQYRMNDKILSFSNAYFYHGKLTSHEKNASWTLPNDNEPLVLIDTSGCGFEEQYNYKTRSIMNEGEYFILREYFLSISEKSAGASIGIICPYSEQAKFVKNAISEDKELGSMDIQTNTIDGFQGQEKDIICISLVRSNITGEIGFLKDFRRLNVALTRARKKLVIIGDFSTLSNHKLFEDLATHAEEIGAYKSAWEFMSY